MSEFKKQRSGSKSKGKNVNPFFEKNGASKKAVSAGLSQKSTTSPPEEKVVEALEDEPEIKKALAGALGSYVKLSKVPQSAILLNASATWASNFLYDMITLAEAVLQGAARDLKPRRETYDDLHYKLLLAADQIYMDYAEALRLQISSLLEITRNDRGECNDTQKEICVASLNAKKCNETQLSEIEDNISELRRALNELWSLWKYWVAQTTHENGLSTTSRGKLGKEWACIKRTSWTWNYRKRRRV